MVGSVGLALGLGLGLALGLGLGLALALGLGLKGEWLDLFEWPRQAQYIVHVTSSSFSSYHNIMSISLLDLYYSGAIKK